MMVGVLEKVRNFAADSPTHLPFTYDRSPAVKTSPAADEFQLLFVRVKKYCVTLRQNYTL